MAKKRVAISTRLFWAEDSKYIAGSSELEIVKLPGMEEVRNTLTEIIEPALGADLLIFCLTGENPLFFIARLQQENRFRLFQKLPFPKVVWSHDTHHMYPYESKAECFYDRFYTVHKNYLHYLSSNARWVPCSYISSSLQRLLKISRYKIQKDIDIISMFRYYISSYRNIGYDKIASVLKKMNINFYFGCTNFHSTSNSTNTYEDLLFSLKRSKISLNIPFSNDFNIRNIESIAMGNVLLAQETAVHKHMDLDYSHSHFFQPDLSDFEAALEAALNDQGGDETWKCVAEKHMLTHRYISIINAELGTDFSLIMPWDTVADEEPDFPHLQGEIFRHTYDDKTLLAHSLASCAHAGAIAKGAVEAAKRKEETLAAFPLLLDILRSQWGNDILYCNMIAMFLRCELHAQAVAILNLKRF